MDADIIVVGAGIVGSACAHHLAADGARVMLVDNQQPGATAAGMGHLVCMDDDPAELALCSYSLGLWRALLPRLSADCAVRCCGTLWLAETPEELALAAEKQQRLAGREVASELLGAQQIRQCEPLLRAGLAGGLRVPGDSIVYAPNAARWFAAARGIVHLYAEATALEPEQVRLADGRRLRAPVTLLANGLQANVLLGEPLLRAKKGQLAITDRYPQAISHQLVELGYGASAHAAGSSVAFNLQARPTGQLLIGSSRQYDREDRALDGPLLARMLARARHFIPSLDRMTFIRCWSGLRAATPDGRPLLGPHPRLPGVWLAAGHEGLGVTTAPATAAILAAQIQQQRPPIDVTPFLPQRLWQVQP